MLHLLNELFFHFLARRASQSGNADMVGRLFDSGADGNILNSRQHSSLHAAVHNSHESVVRCILDKFPEMVQVSWSSHV